MKHDTRFNYCLGAIVRLVALVWVGVFWLCLLLWLSGCSSSRRIEERQVYESHKVNDTDSRTDSTRGETGTVWSGRDTATIASDRRGEVEIKRDSAGRPVFITWHYAGNLQTIELQNRMEAGWLSGVRFSNRATASERADTVGETAEEEETHVDTAISLEKLVGPGLLVCLIIYLIYVFIKDVVWPWIKRKNSL